MKMLSSVQIIFTDDTSLRWSIHAHLITSVVKNGGGGGGRGEEKMCGRYTLSGTKRTIFTSNIKSVMLYMSET